LRLAESKRPKGLLLFEFGLVTLVTLSLRSASKHIHYKKRFRCANLRAPGGGLTNTNKPFIMNLHALCTTLRFLFHSLSIMRQHHEGLQKSTISGSGVNIERLVPLAIPKPLTRSVQSICRLPKYHFARVDEMSLRDCVLSTPNFASFHNSPSSPIFVDASMLKK
jgi:hypothetical protein